MGEGEGGGGGEGEGVRVSMGCHHPYEKKGGPHQCNANVTYLLTYLPTYLLTY